jgi:hypothetical protein
MRGIQARRRSQLLVGVALSVGGFFLTIEWPPVGVVIFIAGVTVLMVLLTEVVWTWARPRLGPRAGLLAVAPGAIAVLFGLTTVVAAGQAIGLLPASSTSDGSPSPGPIAAGPSATRSPIPMPSTRSEQPTPTPGATSMPTVHTSMTPAPSPSPTPQPTPSATPPSASSSFKDGSNDFIDLNDEKATGPAYQDIARVDVESRQGRIQLDTYVRAKPPVVDPVKEEISFVWQIETDGDGSPDFSVMLQNTDAENEFNAPGWTADLFDYKSATARAAEDFPGTVVVGGPRVTVRVFSFAVGFPEVVRVAAQTEHTVFPDPVNDPTNSTTVHDFAPSSQWPDGTEWMVVRSE